MTNRKPGRGIGLGDVVNQGPGKMEIDGESVHAEANRTTT